MGFGETFFLKKGFPEKLQINNGAENRASRKEA